MDVNAENMESALASHCFNGSSLDLLFFSGHQRTSGHQEGPSSTHTNATKKRAIQLYGINPGTEGFEGSTSILTAAIISARFDNTGCVHQNQ